jgi:hypothetical protein
MARYHRIMGGMAHVLNAMLVVANDRLKQLNIAIDLARYDALVPPIATFLFYRF